MKKLLLIDDDKFTHDLVRRYLEDGDYDVELHDAYTALEAFEEIRSGSYDIALVDQRIEVMQGTDIVRSMRNLKIKTDIYIFTGFEPEYIEFQAKDLKDFITGIVSKDKMEGFFRDILEKKK